MQGAEVWRFPSLTYVDDLVEKVSHSSVEFVKRDDGSDEGYRLRQVISNHIRLEKLVSAVAKLATTRATVA
jgi:hypothetical protein